MYGYNSGDGGAESWSAISCVDISRGVGTSRLRMLLGTRQNGVAGRGQRLILCISRFLASFCHFQSVIIRADNSDS